MLRKLLIIVLTGVLGVVPVALSDSEEEDRSGMIEPDGLSAKGGPMIEPNGPAEDGGPATEPNGR